MSRVVRHSWLLFCLVVMVGMAVPSVCAEPEQPGPIESMVLTEPEPEEPPPSEQELIAEPEDVPVTAELTEVEPLTGQDTSGSRYRFGQDKAGSGDDVLNRAGNSSGLSLGKIAISLALVIVLVLFLGFAFKKLTQRVPGSQHMKVISSIPLGQRERLLVIEIQGKQRVLGVTPQQINFLFELEESLPEEKLASEFHSQLQSWLKK